MALPPVTTVIAFGGDHPELRTGEIFLGNGNEAGFNQLCYRTKRSGRKAYGTDGKQLPQYFPIFVTIEEYKVTPQTADT